MAGVDIGLGVVAGDEVSFEEEVVGGGDMVVLVGIEAFTGVV